MEWSRQNLDTEDRKNIKQDRGKESGSEENTKLNRTNSTTEGGRKKREKSSGDWMHCNEGRLY